MSELFTITPVTWDQFWPAAAPLFEMEVREVGLMPPDTLRVDDALGRQMLESGAGYIWAAYDSANRLAGYCIWTLGRNILQSGELTANQGPFYVHPQFRASDAGRRLFKESLDYLKELGVSKILVHESAGSDPRLASFYKRKGAKFIERVYEMDLAPAESAEAAE